ncbi:unnamed protein product [Adineta ricciae]|uniref:Uncharacterized protein n=1 Tax=Adineta ricciae TaxID=249248 RepID=A0A814EXN5_ADIRI|nr:unnamed protein product [Adineta ricciae]
MDVNKGNVLQDADGGKLDGKLDKDARPAKTPMDSTSDSSKAESAGNDHAFSSSQNKKMDAIKAGVESVKESIQGKKAADKVEKANDPREAPSDRVDAALEAGKAATKADEHACKSECHKVKHATS